MLEGIDWIKNQINVKVDDILTLIKLLKEPLELDLLLASLHG